jgi:hypothetical protein
MFHKGLDKILHIQKKNMFLVLIQRAHVLLFFTTHALFCHVCLCYSSFAILHLQLENL